MHVKMFGIGFHKTGTSSFGEAMRILGYNRVANFTPSLLPAIKAGDLREIQRFCEQFDGFEDNPWPLLYRELDKLFPGSKFVLTVRPTDEWIRSVRKHFGGSNTEMREWIYGPEHGDPIGSEEVYMSRYERHNDEVRNYFAARPEDFAILDLAAEPSPQSSVR